MGVIELKREIIDIESYLSILYNLETKALHKPGFLHYLFSHLLTANIAEDLEPLFHGLALIYLVFFFNLTSRRNLRSVESSKKWC